MHYFIGIVPPEKEQERLKTFRNQWPANRIDRLVEPHITLKAQGGLSKDEHWLDKVKEAASRFPAFPIQVGQPQFFGEDILFLSMESAELKELHEILVKAVGTTPEQAAQYFELDHFVAHLTLAKTAHGLSRVELKEMAIAASKEFASFPEFVVESVRVYRQTDEYQGYETYIDFPLKRIR